MLVASWTWSRSVSQSVSQSAGWVKVRTHHHSVRERPLGDRGGGGQGCGDDECRAATFNSDGAVAQPRVAQADVALAQRLRDLKRGETTRSHRKSLLSLLASLFNFSSGNPEIEFTFFSCASENYMNSSRDCIVTTVNCANK